MFKLASPFFFNREPNAEYCGNDQAFPYIISVVGHRDFNTPKEKVKELVKSTLISFSEKWEKCCKGSAPIIVLSGMADGADQIVAKVVEELARDDNRNIKLFPILPYERSTYEKTISKENHETFNYFLDNCPYNYVLPDGRRYLERPLVGVNEGNEHWKDFSIDEGEEARKLQYVDLANYLTLCSHALIAVWDGVNRPDLRGGTSYAVRLKLEGTLDNIGGERRDLLTFPYVGSVVHIKVTRAFNHESSDNETEPRVFIWTKDQKPPFNAVAGEPILVDRTSQLRRDIEVENLGLIAEHKAFSTVLETLGKVNDDILYFTAKIPNFESKRKKSQEYLGFVDSTCNDKNSTELSELVALYENSDEVRYFSVLDCVADHLQKKRTYPIIATYITVSFLFMSISGLLSSFWSVRVNQWGKEDGSFFNFLWEDRVCCHFDAMPILTVLFWFFFVTLVFLYFWAKSQRFHYRYHRCRALAEALRVQIFWRVSDVPDNVSSFYRSFQNIDIEWLRCALNYFSLNFSSTIDKSSIKPLSQIEFIQEHWIKDQHRYFQKGIDRRNKWNSEISPEWDAIKKEYGTEKKQIKRFLIVVRHVLNAAFIGNFLSSIMRFVAYNNIINKVFIIVFTVLVFFQPILDFFFEHFYRWFNCKENAVVLFVGFSVLCSTFTNIYVLSHVYVSLKRYKNEAVRFKRMLYPYERANFILASICELLRKGMKTSAEAVNDFQCLVHGLGSEVLSENAEWLLAAEERELILPR